MENRSARTALALATIAFVVSFALWGMLAPMAKTFQTTLGLTEQQTWLLVAVPVLLGSIGRLPMGMLADRFGGRFVFGALLLAISVPAFMLSNAGSFRDLVLWGLLLGMAGTSFAVGVAFVSGWFSPQKQGLVLGIFALGTFGQSVGLFVVPVLSGNIGLPSTYRLFAMAALAWGVVFLLFARNAPRKATPKSFGQMLSKLREPMSWLLALFYFVTFGGFVALSIGLPKLLQEIFELSRSDAGLRVAGFVVLSTLVRPVGGWLSDRLGGARLLGFCFAGAAVFALFLTQERIVPFTIGALGVAFCIGLGNGAVFKLVPQFFPKDTGTVTGLVGAMGGLGGFFPPLVLGYIKSSTGHYDLGFVLLSVFCLVCLALNATVLLRRLPAASDEPVLSGAPGGR